MQNDTQQPSVFTEHLESGPLPQNGNTQSLTSEAPNPFAPGQIYRPAAQTPAATETPPAAVSPTSLESTLPPVAGFNTSPPPQVIPGEAPKSSSPIAHLALPDAYKRFVLVTIAVGLVVIVGTGLMYFLTVRQQNKPTSQSSISSSTSVSNKQSAIARTGSEALHLNLDTTVAQGKSFIASGKVLLQNTANSSQAFSVQDAAGTSLINVDTKTGTVTITGKLDATNAILPSSVTQLSPNVTQAGNSFNGSSELVQLGSSGILPALNGSALVALNADNISSGTLSDNRLSSNVVLKNSTGNVLKPTANSTNTFQIQNATGTASLLNVDTVNRVIAVNQASANYTLDVNGDVNVTSGGAFRINGIALCSGSGCAAASGSGSYIQNNTSVQTANFAVQSASSGAVTALIKGANGQTANIFQINDNFNDTVLSVSPTGNILIQPSVDSINAFWVQNAAGTSHLIGGDTVNDRVAIAKPTPPSYTLDVGGDINSTTAIRVGGNVICSAGGCAPGAGSGNYVQNSISLQTANFAIQSDANNHKVAVIQGVSGQTADLLDLVAGDGGENVATFGARGNITFQNATDSTTAFQIQNLAGTSNLFVADTTNTRIGIGATPANGLLTIGTNTTTAAGGVTFGTDTSLYRSGNGALTLGGTSGNSTLQAAAAAVSDTAGSNLTLAGGQGTGQGNGGNINLQIAKPTIATPNQSFISGANGPVGVAVDNSFVYWVNNSNNTIGRSNIDGSGANQSFITGASSPYGIAANGSFIYWANLGTNSIARANLNGTGVNLSFITGASQPFGVAIDSGHIYWTNYNAASSNTTIGRANLDGSGVNQSYISGANAPAFITVDSTYIYWVNTGTTTIGRANLDGTGVNQSFIAGGTGGLRGIAVDAAHVYWASGNANAVGRANLDGTGVNQSFITGGSSPFGVALDSAHVYWTNSGSTTIGRLNLGTAANPLSTVASISGINGAATFQNAVDSTTAFQIQNLAGTSNLFVADTTNTRIGLGATPANSLLTIGTNTTTAAGGVTFGTDTSLYRSGNGSLALGGTAGSSTLQAAASVGTDAIGSNLVLAGGQGTGLGNGGNINFQIAQATTVVANQSFVTGINVPYGVASDSSYVYWTSYGGSTIGRANLDGTGVNQSFITGANHPVAVAVNGSFIYWANINANTIGRANLDGTGVNQSFITGTSSPDDLKINSQYIYWTNAGSNTIGRANLDGTGINQGFITANSGVSGPIGLGINNTYIYWINYTPNTIGRANLDGTGINQSFISGLTNAQDIVTDSTYIYWANYGTNSIGRANLDGSSPNQSFISGANGAARLAISSSYLYWTNSNAGTVGRYTFAGTSPNSLTTVATISGTNGSVLFKNVANSTSAFQIQNASNVNALNVDTTNAKITANTSALFQNATDSTTAFQIQNLAGTSNLFVADTTNTRIGLGATPANSLLTIGTNTTTAAGGVTFGTDTSLYRSGNGSLALGGTAGSSTLQAAANSGADVAGSSLVLAGGQGTGIGSGGNINLQIAKAGVTTPNESFITGANTPIGVASDGSTFVYWTNSASNTIGRSNIDGTGANQSFITGANNPHGVTINGSFIYWANYGNNTIGRSNIDGSGVNQSFITGAHSPLGIVVNSSFIYWGNSPTSTVGRANLDGTSPNQSFITGGANVNGVTVDTNFIYWVNANTNTIGRANLDGTSPNQSFIATGTSPAGIAEDSGHIYWTNEPVNTIGRSNIDGSGVNNSFIAGATSPYLIANDSNHIYWANLTANTIGRLVTNGTATNGLSTVASLSGINGAATFQNATDSTTAFQIQNLAGTSNLLVADTTNTRVGIGALPANSLLTIGSNTNTAAGGITFGTDTSLYRSGNGSLALGGTAGSSTLQAAASVGNDAAGSNLILAGGQGTGQGNGGNINLQISKPAINTNQSFISGGNGLIGVAVNSTNVYWTNSISNTIGRANIDGTSPNQSFITGANHPLHITVDGSFIYWANFNANTIGRANIDGSSPNQSFITGANGPIGVAVDSGHIYWTNANANTIGRANLNGTSPNQSFITGANGPNGITVDSVHIYWANWGTGGSGTTIGRANIDGSSPNQSFIAGATGPTGIAVDSNFVYWTNSGSTTIGRANIDGSSPNQSFITGANTPEGVAVDSGHVYWGNNVPNTIGRYSYSSTNNALSTVASISGTNGSATFQNATDSTTAFQIQNSSGQNLLTADTANMSLAFDGANTGALGAWSAQSNSLNTAAYGATSVTANGYVYTLGGCASTCPTATVQYAQLDANGTTGSWSTTTSLGTAVVGATSIVANGYIYEMGGSTGGVTSEIATVQYAKLNTDGTLGTWSTTNNLNTAVEYATSIVANGYVYVMGGNSTSNNPVSTVQYAQLNANGTLGTWSTTNNLNTITKWASSVIANGYVYVIGGCNNITCPLATVQSARLNANGTIGSWSTTNNLNTAMFFHSSIVANGYIYAIGGNTGGSGATGVTSTIQYAQLNTGGTTGTWSVQANSLSTGVMQASTVIANGYIYMMGGSPVGGAPSISSTIQSASTPRVKIGASLDLVGLQGGTLSSADSPGVGSNGGSITAGDGIFVGNLQVQGQGNFVQGVNVSGNFTNTGFANFAGATNSATAFQIQNASGTSLFSVDTSGSTITLGPASATPVILVLGNKNTSGDPATCTAGSVYYNSASDQAKVCLSGNKWGSINGAYVTSLPASSNDGDEVYYQVDPTNGIVWHLRYNSSESTYHWEFLGGSSMRTTGSVTPSSTATFNVTAAAYTAPRAGDYEGTAYYAMGAGNGGTNESMVGNLSPSAGAILEGSYSSLVYGSTYLRANGGTPFRWTSATAGATLTPQVAEGVTSAAPYEAATASLYITPIRIN